ncbi:hypothetical protein PCASD_26408 [Puccinia coronata f. sp. avenae]|uniref:DUF6818 domain-containing protein n=1 Tax=Puccinia coronata f. sp. avenae TaxID=200324 RepID=A0A2N5S5Q4_9BASI|nr:hypothetical protein PCASD_26408 [Puccinia coronata f. sp. avenae]
MAPSPEMASTNQSNAETNQQTTPSQRKQTGQGRASQSQTKQGSGCCTPGCQGYSISDCEALIAAVKQVLPLGSQEWSKVQDIYNVYARENGRQLRESDPLKMKFKTLWCVKKPTGNPHIAEYICDAKEVEQQIRENGVGANVSLDEMDKDEIPAHEDSQMLSGWTDTQRGDTQQQSPTEQHSAAQQRAGAQQNPEQSTFREDSSCALDSGWSNNPSTSACQNTHCLSGTTTSDGANVQRSTMQVPTPLTSRSNHASSTSSSQQPRTRDPPPSLGCPSKNQRPNPLQEAISGYMDPTLRDQRERDFNIAQLYSLQLQEAHLNINRLEEEVTQLRDGLNLQLTRAQDKNTCLKKEMSDNDKDHAKEVSELKKQHETKISETKRDLEGQLLDAQRELAQAQREVTHQLVANSNLRMKLELMMLRMDMNIGSRGGVI